VVTFVLALVLCFFFLKDGPRFLPWLHTWIGSRTGAHIEVVADPRLTAGTVQLLWPDGWLEHAPDTIRHQVDAILAAHRASEPGPSLSGACPGLAATSTGDDHALA